MRFARSAAPAALRGGLPGRRAAPAPDREARPVPCIRQQLDGWKPGSTSPFKGLIGDRLDFAITRSLLSPLPRWPDAVKHTPAMTGAW